MALNLRHAFDPFASSGLVHVLANGAWTFDGGDDGTPSGWADEPVILTLEA